ncbi:hypothetical protein CRG98_025131 [Punica granatum]|uniref:Uncharacterized protein n=1 Tax=Punica granatum TaxID=22663 RepID=A0A2I0JDX6_PUNGR|nr:hypothetical protein CRG98_025131 [Punica granatum]
MAPIPATTNLNHPSLSSKIEKEEENEALEVSSSTPTDTKEFTDDRSYSDCVPLFLSRNQRERRMIQAVVASALTTTTRARSLATLIRVVVAKIRATTAPSPLLSQISI